MNGVRTPRWSAARTPGSGGAVCPPRERAAGPRSGRADHGGHRERAGPLLVPVPVPVVAVVRPEVPRRGHRIGDPLPRSVSVAVTGAPS
ncbi:hypothetical protein GCM10018980_45930 [Streptomyces capoamus]|uniref:Uncharacterized protein n=1 Tax=Streptomyces capoamus TaxID=68183 RepID=A0A919EY07_9ACTN|nr:hypothetical protein GCM10010501_62390 [Streptomyces libani subsp. rufus]GHG58561.1 hypothetical protein GCM10018980_45930 [Streptomyces capoamus]